jgi:hypothetical protein
VKARHLDDFCRHHLGAGIASYRFSCTSVSSVHGLALADWRRLVVKARPPDVDRDHLVAVLRIQEHVSNTGFPCPQVGSTSWRHEPVR